MKNAVSVVVATTGDAVPIYPYKDYVVGALKPDDFSSFELTFTADGADVIPIEVSYKDDDGNQYTRSTDLDLTHATNADGTEGISPILLVLIVILCLGGGRFYLYRKKLLPGVFK